MENQHIRSQRHKKIPRPIATPRAGQSVESRAGHTRVYKGRRAGGSRHTGQNSAAIGSSNASRRRGSPTSQRKARVRRRRRFDQDPRRATTTSAPPRTWTSRKACSAKTATSRTSPAQGRVRFYGSALRLPYRAGDALSQRRGDRWLPYGGRQRGTRLSTRPASSTAASANCKHSCH